MNQRIVYSNDEGGVSIIIPAESVEAAMKDIPSGKPYYIIDVERLRNERIPLLAAQDVAFQRALESGADTTAIVAEKQRLRDITNLVDSCNTLDELSALKVE